MTHLLDIHKTLLMGEAYGLTDKQVASVVNISLWDMKAHWRIMKAILEVESRTVAVVMALREGIIDIEDIHKE